MPTNRRRRSHHRHGGFPPDDVLLQMLEGPPFPADDGAVPPSRLQEQWEDYKDSVLSLWVFGDGYDTISTNIAYSVRTLLAIRCHAKPGTRPHAWWRFTAPEPRKRIAQGPPPDVADCRYRFGYGVPNLFVGNAYMNVRDPRWFETEADYLRRHDLLLPGEADLLAEREGTK